jgi:hypothetical protein
LRPLLGRWWDHGKKRLRDTDSNDDTMSIRDASFDDERHIGQDSKDERSSGSTLHWFDLEGIAADDGLGYTVKVHGSRRRRNRLRKKPPVGGIYVSTGSRAKRDASEINFLNKHDMAYKDLDLESATNVMSPPPTYQPVASPSVPASDHGTPEIPQFSAFGSTVQPQSTLNGFSTSSMPDNSQRRVPFTAMPVPKNNGSTRKSMTPSWLSSPGRGRRLPLNALNSSQGWAVPEKTVVDSQSHSAAVQPERQSMDRRVESAQSSDGSFMQQMAAMRDVMRKMERTELGSLAAEDGSTGDLGSH